MYTILNYLRYWLTSVNEHSLHSPFIYDLYTKTIKANFSSEDFNAIEGVRQTLITSKEKIEVRQLGAHSKVNNAAVRPISAIAKKGLSEQRFSKLLYGIIRNYDCKHIVELGTSFGINTLYLATNPNVHVVTFEGCKNTALLAAETFNRLEYTNIELIEGNIDQTLPDFINHTFKAIDLAFIDANHRYEPTIHYFELLTSKTNENSIIIIDDIYWSKGMSQAWEEIKNHPHTSLTIDLFKAGIVFFNPELKKEHFRLMY